VYNAGLKVDTAREILTVIMTSNDENVCSCKRHRLLMTSVGSGQGHPHNSGHLGHILFGSSGFHPLNEISGSNPDRIT